ncbi:MAG: sigma-70 family RNA polymerase sigma factor [Verrucomicrobiaceae bacterium]|nr:MAG: sigma-70 family RNA polymerase sigma factor [Verrucomicrobiaceae bacterium]
MSHAPDTSHACWPGGGRSSTWLVVEVYEELRRLATLRMMREARGQTLGATALVHEAWLRLVSQGDLTWRNRGHFFAAAAEAMRRILIENARRKSRLRHGGGQERKDAECLDALATPDREEHVLLIEEGLTELEKVNPERARVVVLKFYGGLTNEEVAQSLDLSERSVDRHWACAKVWLLRWVEEAKRA